MVCELAPPRLGLLSRGQALGFPESILTAAASPDVCRPGGPSCLGACPTAALSSSRDMALGVASLDPNYLSSMGEEEMRHVVAEGCLLGFP